MGKPSTWDRLSAPFAEDEIRWRLGNIARSGRKASALAYIDARAVMDRLDEVVGAERWRNQYKTGTDGGTICRIEILCQLPDETWAWVGKEQGAENTQIEAVKGGLSDAFKRAGVQWGIGRYLYRLDACWQDVRSGYAPAGGISVYRKADERRGLSEVKGWVPTPKLPSWAVPDGKEAPSAQQVRRGKHHPEWEAGGQQRFFAQIKDAGVDYNDLKAFLASLDPPKPKPSEIGPEDRDKLVGWLLGDDVDGTDDEKSNMSTQRCNRVAAAGRKAKEAR